MSNEIHRVNIDKMMENDDLLNNNGMITFNLESRPVGGVEPIEFEPFDKDNFLVKHFPKEFEMPMVIGDSLEDVNPSTLTNDFELTQMVTIMQLKILTETLKVAYAKFARSGSEDDMSKVTEASYALDSAKKTLLGAHKDKAKIQKDTGTVSKTPNITTTGDVNIQHNTFQGTPNDMLSRYGDAIDHWDKNKK